MQQSGRKAKLLKDYAPPDYLIEEVELDVALEPKATRVAAKLRLRPNPKVATGGRPLVLDGERPRAAKPRARRQAARAGGLRAQRDRRSRSPRFRPSPSRSRS